MRTQTRRSILILCLSLLTALQSLIPFTAFAEVRMRCAGMAAGRSCAQFVRAADDGARSGTVRVQCACCRTMGAACPLSIKHIHLANALMHGARLSARTCAVTVTVFSAERPTRLADRPQVPQSVAPMAVFALRAPPQPFASPLQTILNRPDGDRLKSRAGLACGLRAPPSSSHLTA